ncbi:RsmB/NOP family class I SAM-dependent RNA methyltransferase [Candidatus Woesearchaeota archaeon]|nr:RsmB/NOP family class I SAM-dependent RNA methyltransferase [Candidatus Woesearchaeota archaeon]
MEIVFKENFVERYKNLTDFDIFKEITVKELRRSIRVNTLKISINELKSRLKEKWDLEQIPWCKEGFFIRDVKGERKDIGNLMEHSLGYFYVQEAASMIPPIILEPGENDIILDMAASPGSKTTQIAALMENKGLIVANDFKYDRIKALGINLQRCGVSNAVITLMDGLRIKNFEFDKILLDAPCSGTGTIRKSLKTLKIYNTKMITKLSNMQKRLIENAFLNLKKGGILVYSTCSLEPEENEGVINHLLNKFENVKIGKINININKSPAIMEFNNETYHEEIGNCLRLWPQDNDTEGFFVAKIIKN